MPKPPPLQDQAVRLAHWMQTQALPLWLERGINPANGLSYEGLLANGDVDVNAALRVRVQARQAFVFAAAAERNWCAAGRACAERMLAAAQAYAAHPQGGYVHLLDRQLRVSDGRQDLYDHAFFLLAYAWLYRVSGDSALLQQSEQLQEYLDARFSSPAGGWIEGDYAHDCRRQNPHMHLLEAFLALYDATLAPQWLARAQAIVALFEQHFYDPQQQVLFEFFEPNWGRYQHARGEQVEPGHMMEWVWLLDWYSRRSGRSMADYTRALYDQGLRIGQASSGLLFDAVSADGRVLAATKRCWGMTELIKASLVQARAGHPHAEEIASQAVADLFRYFLCASTQGAYVDQRGAEDELVVDTAPASSLYHIMMATLELVDHCQPRPNKGTTPVGR
jgi:mannose-6-phosphate isomerase